MAIVLQTDFAWPDTEIERAIIEGAGHTFVVAAQIPPPAERVAQLVKEHNPAAIMTCWAVVNEQAISFPSDLRIVERLGVGLDNIAVSAATARGSWVANVPHYCIEEVSDHALALVLDWARGVTVFARETRAGRWDPASARLRRVSSLSVGLIGYGPIARATARKLRGFGCDVGVHTPSLSGDDAASPYPIDELAARSDIIIVHAPLNAKTHHMIDEKFLASMKPGSFLINVSRGPLVDTGALLGALRSGHLAGAALDVVEGEPIVPEALSTLDNVVLTPHVAFSSDSSLIELRRDAAEEVVRVLAGERPFHPCNDPVVP